jgi:hypothetical protein
MDPRIIFIAHCAKLNDTGGPARKKLKQVFAPERMPPG